MFPYKEKTGVALKQEAQALGVTTHELVGEGYIESEPLLQGRVRSAKLARWARNSWIIALVSAIASVISAVAAFVAIYKR